MGGGSLGSREEGIHFQIPPSTYMYDEILKCTSLIKMLYTCHLVCELISEVPINRLMCTLMSQLLLTWPMKLLQNIW